MEQFPHLKFIQKQTGKPRLHGGGDPNETSEKNRSNRGGHSQFLISKTSSLKNSWQTAIVEREGDDLASLNAEVVPLFIQINPDLLVDLEFDLQNFGIEIISEEDNGFIIGASLDNLRALEEKIAGFAESKYSTGKIADFWNIIEGNREEWKPRHVLSEELYSKWHQIVDDQDYKVEIGIAFDKPLKEPKPGKQGYEKRLKRYREDLIRRDIALMERQNHFEDFINHYGELLSGYVDLDDSFSCEALISGKGLKDLVVNYQFVFEVNEIEIIGGTEGNEFETGSYDFEVLAPDDDSVVVGVIDSGIMENHRYLAAAIDSKNSKSYIKHDKSCADEVRGGGHGTKVAGAILYPNGISTIGSPYKLPCFIRNLRVLDKDNFLVDRYPAELMQEIVRDNKDCKIFNLSITSQSPHRSKHMSTWAACIDTATHEDNVLFIISAGNLYKDLIQHYIKNGENYPDYLHNVACRIANPSQSSFSITVGSVNHAAFDDNNWKSLGDNNNISAFSRIGSGIWNAVKPDVVEYGGGYILSKNGLNQIIFNNMTAPELIRSTLHGGSAYGNDSVGTSFSAPKVTYIAAILKNLYPEENVNLIRAFIAQGARLPNEYFQKPTLRGIQFFGYGIPSLDRVTKNTEHRITFYNTNTITAEDGHIYALKVPDDLSNAGNDYDILLEVTLAYTAKVRRTRQKTKSYLSTWLDWQSSYLDESLEEYEKRSLREINGEVNPYDANGGNVIKWKIRENSDWGEVKGISRNNSTLQKDWVILKSYELPTELCFTVRGHKGWDKNKEEVPYALTVSIEILGANVPIYEAIRIENEIEIPITT